MALLHHNATTSGASDRPVYTVTGYFARYRLALYLVLGAGIGTGIALNRNWLTAARLLPVLARDHSVFWCFSRAW